MHKYSCHATSCDVVNDVKLFSTVYRPCTLFNQMLLKFTLASALECVDEKKICSFFKRVKLLGQICNVLSQTITFHEIIAWTLPYQ